MTRHHQSPKSRAEAVKRVHDGDSPHEVAESIGVHVATIRNWTKAAGWPSSKPTSAPVVASVRAQAPNAGQVVYFLAAEDVDRVKVGFTRDRKTIVKRMSSLAYSSPVPVTLMKVIAGSMQGERWLHAKWAEHRHHGEWFTLSAIRADIEAMESVRDVSAEVEAAKACADCGIYRKGAKRGQVRCRACAGKARRIADEVVERSCIRCGLAMRPLKRSEVVKRASRCTQLCASCGMAEAWDRADFTAKMKVRGTKKRCVVCGKPGVKARHTAHAECELR